MFNSVRQDGAEVFLPAELCAAVEQLGIAVANVSLDGKWLRVDQRLCQMLGFSQTELEGKPLLDFFEDSLRVDADYQRLLSGEIPAYAKESKAKTKGGNSQWVRVAFSVVFDPEAKTPQYLVAAIEDNTDRKQADNARREIADRLIQAQETERTRIARELHDDIGQSLAILRIQMMRSGQPVSGMPGRVHPNVIELSERVMEIANRVSRISHQLHSSHLEYLGLKAAVQNACDEFAGKYKIKVNCTCEHIPPKIDGITGLCFLRVLQEGLHNIGKHSNAKNVDVHLLFAEGELSLLIVDNGKGFDLQEARLAAGLGLISMRERVNLVGGNFEITSTPGRGTRVRASAPVTITQNADTSAVSR